MPSATPIIASAHFAYKYCHLSNGNHGTPLGFLPFKDPKPCCAEILVRGRSKFIFAASTMASGMLKTQYAVASAAIFI